jgi:hypothetical protein
MTTCGTNRSTRRECSRTRSGTTSACPSRLRGYFYYFLTGRGRTGLTTNRRDIAKVIWTRNSPNWNFDDQTFQRAAEAFDNPDFVDVVLHSYRHRLGYAPGFSAYHDIEAQPAHQPTIAVPTVTLDGTSDGNFPCRPPNI